MSQPVTITLTDAPDGGVDFVITPELKPGDTFEITPSRVIGMMMLAYLKEAETFGCLPRLSAPVHATLQ